MHSKQRLLLKLFTGLLCTNHVKGFTLLTMRGNYLFKRQWKQVNDSVSCRLVPAKSMAAFPLGARLGDGDTGYAQMPQWQWHSWGSAEVVDGTGSP